MQRKHDKSYPQKPEDSHSDRALVQERFSRKQAVKSGCWEGRLKAQEGQKQVNGEGSGWTWAWFWGPRVWQQVALLQRLVLSIQRV